MKYQGVKLSSIFASNISQRQSEIRKRFLEILAKAIENVDQEQKDRLASLPTRERKRETLSKSALRAKRVAALQRRDALSLQSLTKNFEPLDSYPDSSIELPRYRLEDEVVNP